eukprot:g45068.t1
MGRVQSVENKPGGQGAANQSALGMVQAAENQRALGMVQGTDCREQGNFREAENTGHHARCRQAENKGHGTGCRTYLAWYRLQKSRQSWAWLKNISGLEKMWEEKYPVVVIHLGINDIDRTRKGVLRKEFEEE